MPFLELFDETLDINSTENYELTIEISKARFCFLLLDSIRKKFILLRSFSPDNNNGFSPEQIREIILSDDFLSRKYRNTHLVISSPRFTIIPVALYDPGRKDEYFSFNHVASENEVVLNNKIPDPESFLLFSANKHLISLVNESFPGIIPMHHLKPLLDHVAVNSKHSDEFHIHAHIESDFFNLLIFKNKLLQFSNSFYFRNITDIMYYILNVFRNLEIKQESTIYLSGQTEMYDDLYSSISLYIRDIRFAEPSGNFTYSYVFNDLDLHKYINPITAVNCV